MAVALLFHVWDHELASEERPLDVHSIEQVPVAHLHLLDGAGHEDGGVVYQDVDASVLLDGPLEQVGDVVFLRDVAADADGLTALGADAVDGGLDAAWDSEVALVLGAGRHDHLRGPHARTRRPCPYLCPGSLR